MPLKLFVVSAGAMGTSLARFGAVMFTARVLRYFGEAWLGITVGRESTHFLTAHAWHFIAAAAALFLALYGWVLFKERAHPEWYPDDRRIP